MDQSFYGAMPWLAAAGYLWLTWLHWKKPVGGAAPLEARSRQIGLFLVMGLHGAALLPNWFAKEGLQFGFATAISWTLWLAVLLTWIESWFQKLPPLARSIFPIAALASVLPVFFAGPSLSGVAHAGFRAHMLLAMLAYSTFTLATASAVLMITMERSLHQTKKRLMMDHADWWQGMPSLLGLDQTLVRVVFAGFVLLSLTLVSGVFVSLEMGYGLMRFDHKTIFTIATWFLALTLLLGRRWWGWRGRVAARWTIAGYVSLLMAYVGTRFVLEILLQRSA
jgi:ABC-type uncharacterized transport system permease subunit